MKKLDSVLLVPDNDTAGESGREEGTKMDADTVDQEARARHLCIIDSGPLTGLTRAWADSYDKYGIARMGETGRPPLPSDGNNAVRHDAPMREVWSSTSVDGPAKTAIRMREYDPRVPGNGEREAANLERAIRRALRGYTDAPRIVTRRGKRQPVADTGSTFDASIRQLAMWGKLSDEDRSCESCNGTGVDPEYVNLGNLPCAECIGTGRRAIMPRHRPLKGFLDPYRYEREPDEPTGPDGTLHAMTSRAGRGLIDRVERHKSKVRSRYLAKIARKRAEKGNGRCAQRKHSWQESESLGAWCSRCGKQRRVKLVPAQQ